MKNSLRFYEGLFLRFQRFGLRLPNLLRSFCETFQREVESVFSRLLYLSSRALLNDDLGFYLLSNPLGPVLFRVLRLVCNLLKSERILGVCLRVYLEILSRWVSGIKSISFAEAVGLEGKTERDFEANVNMNANMNVNISGLGAVEERRRLGFRWLLSASSALSRLLTLLEPAFRLSVGQELLLRHLFPILRVQFVSHFSVLCPLTLCNLRFFTVTFDSLNLFVTLSDDLLNKDYLLCIDDQSKIEGFSLELKSVLDARLPFFEELFWQTCSVFLHPYQKRLLVGVSAHRDLAENMFSHFGKHFGVRLELKRDAGRQNLDFEPGGKCILLL